MTPREPIAGPADEGTLLWEPTEHDRAHANLTRYLGWLKTTKGLAFASYEDLWQWSVTDLETFWATMLEFFQVIARRPDSQVLADRRVMGARWCPGVELNYAEHALRRRDAHPAVIFRSEGRPPSTLTFGDLYRQTAVVASALTEMGVRRGDRVAAFMPNIPETLIAFLAAASVGAVWSSCPPEFGTRSVLDRFRQIEPRVLFAVDGYRYNGQAYDRLAAVKEIRENLPTVDATVLVPYLTGDLPAAAGHNVRTWPSLFARTAEPNLAFERVPFEHPLWILYSSGTTGLPKAIVQGHGGILLEHLKAISLHLDLGPDDRFFWFTTTGWMMWNFLVSGLLLGTTIILYDGSPAYPSIRVLWQMAEETGMTYFGSSAPFLTACMKAGFAPGKAFDLGRLRGLGSTGAPLVPEGFGWVYDHVKGDVLLGSISGGTDLCTAFVLSCPLLPVRAGEIQCRGLGAKVEAYDPAGRPVMEEVGELVITEPLPSMPLRLWNDPDGRRYRASYFETFSGVWRHGDWIKITDRGSCVIYGRSDATINRAGVRMGTSDFYRVVEDMPEVLDSLAIDTGRLGREGELLLFVVLREGQPLEETLKARIKRRMRDQLSPRHVPDEIYAVPEVPRTLNGKKVEVPVKRILAGTPAEQAVSADALSNPRALRFFVDLAARLNKV